MERKHAGRALAGIIGGSLVLQGAFTVSRGEIGWRNYWGALVYAPFAVVIGLLLFVALFKRPSAGRRRQRGTKDRSGFSWTKGHH